MLIIEGSDLVGKTTFCAKLLKMEWAQTFGYTYQHLSKLSSGFNRLTGHLALARRRVIQDRFHLSDLAYRYALKEDQRLKPEEYRIIDGYLRGLGAYTVVVCADDEL